MMTMTTTMVMMMMVMMMTTTTTMMMMVTMMTTTTTTTTTMMMMTTTVMMMTMTTTTTMMMVMMMVMMTNSDEGLLQLAPIKITFHYSSEHISCKGIVAFWHSLCHATETLATMETDQRRRRDNLSLRMCPALAEVCESHGLGGNRRPPRQGFWNLQTTIANCSA